MVVFWDGEKKAAVAHHPTLEGEGRLTFQVVDGAIRDAETGSRWTVHGHAVDGPLTGSGLAPVAEAYTAFWFAWAGFHPNSALWLQGR